MSNTNFYQVLPNSHFWANFDQLINFLRTQKDSTLSKEELIDYLNIGLANSIGQGYDLRKKTEQGQQLSFNWYD